MPPANPQSPNPNFDFILKEKQPSRAGLPLANLPKPAKIGLAVLGGIILIIVITSLLSGKGGTGQPLIGVLARGQEILRVTQLVQQQQPAPDQATLSLAATVSSDLSSDQQQLTAYLANNKIKVSTAQLAIDTDHSSDTLIQNAAQNNNLDQAYISYLQQNLNKYENDLQTAYKAAGPNGKAILQTAFDGTSTLLTNPPLKS